MKNAVGRRAQSADLLVSTLALAAAIALASGPPVHAGSLPPQLECSVAKNLAVAGAFSCVARARNTRTPAGHNLRCNATLSKRFAKAEQAAGGSCPTTRDAADVELLLVEIEEDLFQALLASQGVSTRAAKRCVAVKNRAAATSAVCRAEALRQLFLGKLRAGAFERCVDSTVARFSKAQARGGCPREGDAMAAVFTASRVGYWANANLSGLDLSGADLTGADLRGADLTGALLGGACLDGVNGVDLAACPAELPIGWVEWFPSSTVSPTLGNCPGWGTFSDDNMCLGGATRQRRLQARSSAAAASAPPPRRRIRRPNA